MIQRWSKTRANAWHQDQPFLIGANFIPSTAINQIEMWSAGTWDAETIDRELGWAAAIGMNSMRVYLHDLVWKAEGDAFLSRVDQFLAISARHGIRPLLVIFDDCWHEPVAGTQPEPRPGIHNSGWVRSPGRDILLDVTARGALEAYVRAVIRRFADDDRILGWDIYNEPANYILPSRSLAEADRREMLVDLETSAALQREGTLALLKDAFAWARAENPAQPLTTGAWNGDRELNAVLHEHSDVISFHNYLGPDVLEKIIDSLRHHERPLFCTEYMGRRHGSLFANHLPIFAREKIACWNWGLVDGKTQTKYAWEDGANRWHGTEPNPWFHDIFHRDGRAYNDSEVDALKRFSGETHDRSSDP